MVTRITTSRPESSRGNVSVADGGELKPILDDAFDEYNAKQERGELRTIAHIVSDIDPKTVVEIGTADGGSLCVWSRYFDSTERIVSIDKGHTPEQMDVCQSMEPETDIRCIDDVSQGDNAIELTKKFVEPWGIDFLFVDGGSSKHEVLSDYHNFVDDVNEGGLIAFHDILTHRDRPERVDVHEVWNEVKHDAREHVEIVSHPDATEYGFGVMYL